MDETQANLVVDWYLELETRLTAAVKITQFNDQTSEIFLPPLANIILDCGSLLDTVFRECYRGAVTRDDLNIVHYSQEFEPRLKLSSLSSLLFQTPLQYINPFDGWVDANTGKYQSRQWWQDYNHLKHDRIQEYRRATLDNAVNCLCALHQAVSMLEVFKEALIRHDLIRFGSWGRKYALDAVYKPKNTDVTLLVETELFGTPLGYERFSSDPTQINAHRFGGGGRKLWRFVGSYI